MKAGGLDLFFWQHPHVHNIAIGKLETMLIHVSRLSASDLTEDGSLAGSCLFVVVQSRKKLKVVEDAVLSSRILALV